MGRVTLATILAFTAALASANLATAQRPAWRPPDCPYGLAPGTGPMRCADPPRTPAETSPRAASRLDACGLITESEASHALGEAVVVVRRDTFKGGQPMRPPFDICEYQSPGLRRCRNQPHGFELTVVTKPDSVSYSRFEDSKLVSGVGDKAYYRAVAPDASGPTAGGLQIYKGDRFVQLRLTSIELCRRPGKIPSNAYSLLVNLAKLIASRMDMPVSIRGGPDNGAASTNEQQTPQPGQSTPQVRSDQRIDINSASLEELSAILGLGGAYAQKIIDGRPYRGTADLLAKHVLPEAVYDKISHRIVAKPTAAALPPQKPITSKRDVAELSAKRHPGEKWGDLLILRDEGDNVGQSITIRVPNTVADGALITVPDDRRNRDFYHEVRGYVRRGKGEEGLDVFEVVAIRLEVPSSLRTHSYYSKDYKDRPDGWESLANIERWTHRGLERMILLNK